jgi:hypothetical protein
VCLPEAMLTLHLQLLAEREKNGKIVATTLKRDKKTVSVEWGINSIKKVPPYERDLLFLG